MWIMWVLSKNEGLENVESCENMLKNQGKMINVEKWGKRKNSTKNPHSYCQQNVDKNVDNVDN